LPSGRARRHSGQFGDRSPCGLYCNESTVQSVSLSTAKSSDGGQDDELIDAALGASRVLVAVAARSLAGLAEDMTLAQYRALVELAARGPQRLADLAAVLAVERSTATRMCDRLARKHLVSRRRISADRRGVRVDDPRVGLGEKDGQSASVAGQLVALSVWDPLDEPLAPELAITRAQRKWRQTHNWSSALTAFRIHFGDRIPDTGL